MPGSLQTRYTYDVDRNFFERGGPRPGGGSDIPVLTEDALEIVYATCLSTFSVASVRFWKRKLFLLSVFCAE